MIISTDDVAIKVVNTLDADRNGFTALVTWSIEKPYTVIFSQTFRVERNPYTDPQAKADFAKAFHTANLKFREALEAGISGPVQH